MKADLDRLRPRWQLQQAENRFSEVVERAIKEGPQTVTKHGEDTVVIVSVAEFRRTSAADELQSQSLTDFLLQSPLRGSRVRIRRSRDTGKLIEFGK